MFLDFITKLTEKPSFLICKHLTLSTLVASAMYRTCVRNQLSNQWLSSRASEHGIGMSRLLFLVGTQHTFFVSLSQTD